MVIYLIRATFVVLIAAVALTQFARIRASVPMEAPGKLEQDVRALGPHEVPSSIPETVAASVPQCAPQLLLTTVHLDGSGSATARYVLTLPREARFVYLGLAGGTANPVQIAARWATGSALHILGLRERKAPTNVVLVQIPASCPHLKNLDWTKLSPWR